MGALKVSGQCKDGEVKHLDFQLCWSWCKFIDDVVAFNSIEQLETWEWKACEHDKYKALIRSHRIIITLHRLIIAKMLMRVISVAKIFVRKLVKLKRWSELSRELMSHDVSDFIAQRDIWRLSSETVTTVVNVLNAFLSPATRLLRMSKTTKENRERKFIF